MVCTAVYSLWIGAPLAFHLSKHLNICFYVSFVRSQHNTVQAVISYQKHKFSSENLYKNAPASSFKACKKKKGGVIWCDVTKRMQMATAGLPVTLRLGFDHHRLCEALNRC